MIEILIKDFLVLYAAILLAFVTKDIVVKRVPILFDKIKTSFKMWNKRRKIKRYEKLKKQSEGFDQYGNEIVK